MIKEFVTNKLKNSLGLYDLGEHLEILEEQKKSIEEKNKRNVQLLKDTYDEKISKLNKIIKYNNENESNLNKTIVKLKNEISDMNKILNKEKEIFNNKIECNEKLLSDLLNQKNNEIENIKHELTILYTKLMFMEHKGKFNYHRCLKEINNIIERCK